MRPSQNLGRVQRFQDKQRALELMLFKLRQRPTERRENIDMGVMRRALRLHLDAFEDIAEVADIDSVEYKQRFGR